MWGSGTSDEIVDKEQSLTMNTTVRSVLEEATLTREMVDRFLDPNGRNWAVFDPELGYLLRDSVIRDGLDGSYTIHHYRPFGERRMLNFADHPCRVNTYGDSFTQCHQVSDGETWQEYLAAHFGEPIRNLGIGGYGVYQAYRRMLRQEKTAVSAEYVILNIFSDDHYRSIYRWRWIHIPYFRNSYVPEMELFHANPWAHVRLNPSTGEFEEHPNPYPTPESLYQLCDKEHVYGAFKDAFEIQAFAATLGATDVKLENLREIGDVLEVPTDFSSPAATAETARTLLRTCALRASTYVLNEARAFTESEGKRLMILLSYPISDVISACQGLPRWDQPFIDYLKERGFDFIDSLEKHVEDFQTFVGSPEEYTQRFYVGHYNPRGNHFFAFAVKDGIVEWLDPKPPTYREGGPSLQTLAAVLA